MNLNIRILNKLTEQHYKLLLEADPNANPNKKKHEQPSPAASTPTPSPVVNNAEVTE